MAAAAAAGDGDVVDPRATTVVQVAAGEAHSLALTGALAFSHNGHGFCKKNSSGSFEFVSAETTVVAAHTMDSFAEEERRNSILEQEKPLHRRFFQVAAMGRWICVFS